MNEEIQEYIGIKRIKAFSMTLGAYNEYRGWKLPEDENPDDDGYLVEYTDSPNSNHPNHENYISWSPKDVFDRAYRPIDGITFGDAIEALKRGFRVSRAGWNGKGMYLWMMEKANVKAEWCREPHLKALAERNGGSIEAHSSIRMLTADRKIVTGWVPSQVDMSAEDWFIYAEPDN